ncbi:MAG: glycosyltransferase family 1 protein [Bacteroidota bacterium]
MRIGIDARAAVSVTDGIGRYAVELLRAYSQRDDDHEYTVLRNPVTRVSFRHDERFREIDVPVERFSLREQWVLPRLLGGMGLDLFHSLHMSVPLRHPGPMVMTIHDIFPMLLPWSFGRGNFVNRVAAGYLAVLIRRSVRRSSLVIVDSDHTANDLRTHSDIDGSRLRRIYLGTDHVAARPDNKENSEPIARTVPGRFLLTVTNFRPHKNTERVVEAFAFAKAAVPDLALVVVGDDPKGRAASLGDGQGLRDMGVLFCGFVDEATLLSLYRRAEAFVYPSLYEGFGFPVLEAMACGAPVITSAAASIPELGGDAVIYVEPTDSRNIADAVVRVCTSNELQEDLRRRGLIQSKRFAWRTAAQETLEVYEEAVRTPAGVRG